MIFEQTKNDSFFHVILYFFFSNQRFECGRWFGKGVEDGAIERLLIAESIQAQKIADLVQKSDVSRGYSIGRHWNRFWTLSDQIPATDQLPDLIGQAVNLLCRACIYDSAGSKSDSNGITCEVFTNRALFDLLLGETQILATFAAIFHDGFRCKSSRYSFRPSDHLWDVLVRNRTTGDSAADDTDSEHFSASIGKLLQRIDEQAATLSKEDRVRLLVLICLRDHLLLSLFRSMLRSRCLSTHYDTGAFLRQSSTSNFLEQVLSPLQHIRLQLPPEITKGI